MVFGTLLKRCHFFNFNFNFFNTLYPEVKGQLAPPAGIICFSSHHSLHLKVIRRNPYLPRTEVKQQIINQLSHWKTKCCQYPKGMHWTLFARFGSTRKKKKPTILTCRCLWTVPEQNWVFFSVLVLLDSFTEIL